MKLNNNEKNVIIVFDSSIDLILSVSKCSDDNFLIFHSHNPEEFGLAVKNHKALCFVHDDRHASLHFERNKKIRKCFACGVSGKGVVSLVMAYNKCDYVTACIWLCDKFNIEYQSFKKKLQ